MVFSVPPSRFDASNSRCLVRVFRDGPLRHLAYDIELRFTRYAIDIAGSSITARLDPRSLRVSRCLRDDSDATHQIGDSDKRHIEELADEVLEGDRFNDIALTGELRAKDDGGFVVEGDLTLHGETRRLRAESVAVHTGQRLEFQLHQPDFGVIPFQTLQGALSIKPEVSVRVDLYQR